MTSVKADVPPSGIFDARDSTMLIRDDLLRTEAKLATLLDSQEALISEISHYLIDGAGKRLRPLFILLVYRASGGADAKVEDAIDAAIALELIHSATLLHDDIIDGGLLRRGKPSAFARYGAAASLVTGDFLFCRAFELCGRFEERLVQTAARACIQLTEGEVMEGRMRHHSAATFDDYLEIITRKTASLFAAGGRVAADLAGGSPATIATMEKLGLAFGRAFQMIDDVLDIVGPEAKIGKPVGSDLRAGVLSLPAVIGMDELPELRAFFANGKVVDEASFKHALDLMSRPAVIGRARAHAADQIAIARTLVAQLAPSQFRQSLAQLIDDQTTRAN
ncbi:MAG TPA: polyprenyl synthetase family protein [Candidatus Binataceae bacterium]|nr:polyprenyl synthetase family protein [Candidatus Binataceae bacterium]